MAKENKDEKWIFNFGSNMLAGLFSGIIVSLTVMITLENPKNVIFNVLFSFGVSVFFTILGLIMLYFIRKSKLK